MKTSVLLTGDYQHRDFVEAVDWLVDRTSLVMASTFDVPKLVSGSIPRPKRSSSPSHDVASFTKNKSKVSIVLHRWLD